LIEKSNINHNPIEYTKTIVDINKANEDIEVLNAPTENIPTKGIKTKLDIVISNHIYLYYCF
jgi:hypothetical protein